MLSVVKTYEDQEFNQVTQGATELSDLKFVDCQFNNCRFEDLTLTNVQLQECSFSHCTIANVTTTFSAGRNLQFEQCNLIGISWGELVIDKYSLVIDRLTNSLLKYNNFIGMELPNFSFTTNEILNSNFEDCNFQKAQFNGCELADTQFISDDLRRADFTAAHNYFVDLQTNRIEKASFSFPDVMGLLESLDIKTPFVKLS